MKEPSQLAWSRFNDFVSHERVNLQEGWWRLFRCDALAGQSFANPDEIEQATRLATAQLNHRAKPWVWGRPPKTRRRLRQLIGNLTRDPQLRYTASGRPVCDIGLATNRQWTTDKGEKKEETEFHRIVVWNKLAEICGQYLKKGRKAYFRGRLSTRPWTAQDGTQKTTTEIIAEDMIILSSDRDTPHALSGSPDEKERVSAPVLAQEEPPVSVLKNLDI